MILYILTIIAATGFAVAAFSNSLGASVILGVATLSGLVLVAFQAFGPDA